MAAACAAGMERPWEILSLTPREIEWAFSALEARQRGIHEAADLTAFLIGRYVLSAVHAPGRYPAAPNGILRRGGSMTEAEMKSALVALAERRTPGAEALQDGRDENGNR